ncbi:uncharacterized protein UV8b_02063 [Ustilaginoidea virens]|uniref:N-acetylgalactosaminide beta-1,3-galactosyltransferase n=1 Tax=Ustilaginoidea virens TaxID=1159556 RepID=A0A063BSX5_USTVR|nr:uncharacterized protein UV8b_02063 [Ustilaginoidea virens]QUC17822.1 hypothetical protein UV8b_02063 [Ustilaginoidea virens]GAO19997.1 hypothetical protein UVI_02049070 [Ustilaginoidea virens]
MPPFGRRRLSSRRRWSQVGILILIISTVWYMAQPPDSPIVLAVSFNVSRLRSALAHGDRDAWLRKPGSYPVHLPSEVGCLIKTGYGTRDRVGEQLAALGVKGGVLGDEGRDFLVVGDWTNGNGSSGPQRGWQVHDAVRLVMESEVGRRYSQHPRLQKYRSLQGAVEAGDTDKAEKLGKTFGWELDALKFIMGMEMSYKRMPHKKWYVILDDDTFVVKESLELLLSHLDPSKPQYVGNAVGDYKARFAHGGSAVIISGQAVKMLFRRPDIVAEAYARSMDETWGDRLVATTLQKIGVYIDERYSHYFNGEGPDGTRIRPDRACSPIVSFHGLRKPGDMVRAGRVLGKMNKPLRWGDLWELFGKSPVQSYAETRPRWGDHVGPGGEEVRVWKGLSKAEDCQRKCKGWCLAWTYDTDTRECRASPWFVVGSESVPSTRLSGINWAGAARSAFRKCSLAS